MNEKVGVVMDKKILLCQHPLLSKMFSQHSCFREALGGCAYFPDHSPQRFELLLVWVSTGALIQMEGRLDPKASEWQVWEF